MEGTERFMMKVFIALIIILLSTSVYAMGPFTPYHILIANEKGHISDQSGIYHDPASMLWGINTLTPLATLDVNGHIRGHYGYFTDGITGTGVLHYLFDKHTPVYEYGRFDADFTIGSGIVDYDQITINSGIYIEEFAEASGAVLSIRSNNSGPGKDSQKGLEVTVGNHEWDHEGPGGVNIAKYLEVDGMFFADGGLAIKSANKEHVWQLIINDYGRPVLECVKGTYLGEEIEL